MAIQALNQRRVFQNEYAATPMRARLPGMVNTGDHRRTDAAKPEIRVTVREVANGAGRAVEVVIADSGVGIPADKLGRVFEPYFTTKKHGTGLGLALVRQTIHDHGGTVTVASEPGRGTAFTVKLPLPAGSVG